MHCRTYIDTYVDVKKLAFDKFLDYTIQLAKISEEDSTEAIEFIKQQIQPNVDARVFEIVSYSSVSSARLKKSFIGFIRINF